MASKILPGTCLKTHSFLGWRASGLFLAAAVSLCAQGIPHDWTHDHVVFSNPDGASDAVKNDPRLAIQNLRKGNGKDKGQNNAQPGQNNGQSNSDATQGDAAFPPITGLAPNSKAHKPPPPPDAPKGDWSYFLGSVAGAGMAPGTYPATVVGSFTAPACSDIAMFTINQIGSATQPSIVAFKNLYTGGAVAATSLGTVTANNVATGNALTIGTGTTLTVTAGVQASGTVNWSVGSNNTDTVTIGSVTYTFNKANPAAGSNTAVNVQMPNNSSATAAQNFAAAINADQTQCVTNPCFGSGTTTANPSASGSFTGTTTTVTARAAGTVGNSITFTKTGTDISSISGSGTLTGGVGTGAVFAYQGASATTLAANIASAIASNGSGAGVTATASNGTITVSATTAGTPGNSIALGTPGFTGFTWASSTLLGGAAAGLCNSVPGPTVAWAYNITTTPVTTSPVLSLDGTKVAFIEQGTTTATLHLLKFANGDGSVTGTTPTLVYSTKSLTPVTNFGAAACSGSCVVNFTYGGKNTNSSPFYSYAEDAIYVGDDGGTLYRIAPIFLGGSTVPSVTWSTLVHSTFGLKSPVLDFNLQRVVVADTGGQVSTVSTTGAHSVAGTYSASNTGATIVNGPILDITLGKMLAFVDKDGAAGTNAIVLQASTADLTGQQKAIIGTASTAVPINLGQLDNNYFAAPNPSTGALYTCGNPNGAPTLYRIGFNSSGVMSTTVATGPALATSGNCSPMVEVFNTGTSPGTDWLFTGVSANCAFGSSASGCVDSINITGWQASTSYALNQLILDSNMNIQRVTTAGTSGASPPGTWNTTQLGTTADNTVTWKTMGQVLPSGTFTENAGTSGIVIDELGLSGDGHNSNVYFTTQGGATCATGAGSGGSTCAVNLTQAGLH